MNLGRIAIVAQGSYNLTRTYKKLDTVEFNGSMYVALMALDEGESPTIAPTKWMLGAGKGKDFNYSDFTPEQIQLLQQPAIDAAALANEAVTNTKLFLKGKAEQGNAPTPYDAVTYPDGLFETYIVRTPLTMPNSWGSAVTQAELDVNFVYFDVKNGVVSKNLSLKPTVDLSAILNPLGTTKAPQEKAVADYVTQKINGAEIETPFVIDDFTPSANGTISMSGDELQISNASGTGFNYASLENSVDDIKFKVTSNSFGAIIPNWLGVGYRNSKLIILNIRTSDAQRGQVYEVLSNFGVDSTSLKSAFTTDNGAYTLAVNDWVRVKRVGSKIELYKLVGADWVLLGISDLTGLGITFGFSFVNTTTSSTSTNLRIAKTPTKLNFSAGLQSQITKNETDISTITSKVNSFNLGNSRIPTLVDLTAFNSTVNIDDDDISIKGDGVNIPLYYFNPNIRMIEFTLPTTLIDGATQYSIITSKNSTLNKFSYVGLRTTTTQPFIKDLFSTAENAQNINASGRFASPNLPLEDQIEPIASGDKLRLFNDGVKFFGFIKKVGDSDFRKLFYFDVRGNYIIPNREGFGTLLFGLTRAISGINTNTVVAMNNVRVWDYKDINGNVTEVYNETLKQIYRDISIPKVRSQMKWVAIGDSITAMNEDNRKGFIGIANNILGYNLINKGSGGWTIYKLWRDRVSQGWVSEITNADLITISAGTNDFDTGFLIPASDSIMDTTPDPHPRFGTFDSGNADFKDTHTTLGALRLMIEYILTNAPQARLVITLPAFRLKKKVNGGTIETWTVNSEGRTIFDYADAIKKVATEYNLEYVDFIFNAGVNALNIDKYMYDKLHFNENGSLHFGNILLRKLNH